MVVGIVCAFIVTPLPPSPFIVCPHCVCVYCMPVLLCVCVCVCQPTFLITFPLAWVEKEKGSGNRGHLHRSDTLHTAMPAHPTHTPSPSLPHTILTLASLSILLCCTFTLSCYLSPLSHSNRVVVVDSLIGVLFGGCICVTVAVEKGSDSSSIYYYSYMPMPAYTTLCPCPCHPLFATATTTSLPLSRQATTFYISSGVGMWYGMSKANRYMAGDRAWREQHL